MNASTIEFELPNGIEIDGELCTTVVMRKLKNKDILAVQQDVGLKKLSSERFDIKDNMNPVMMSRINAALIQMFSLTFALTIESIGGKPIKRRTFDDMYQEDFQLMMEKYGKLNGVEADENSSPFEVLGI